jgi:hypothetical protein
MGKKNKLEIDFIGVYSEMKWHDKNLKKFNFENDRICKNKVLKFSHFSFLSFVI